jgi:prefoldin subunit 4
LFSSCSYKQGDAFFHLKPKAALKTLKIDRRAIERDIKSLEKKVEECETGMKDLKVQL